MKGSRRRNSWPGKVGGLGAAGPRGPTIPVTGKPRYISRTVTGNAAVAEAKLAELVAEVTGGHHDGPEVTFGSLLDRWLAHATTLKGLSPTTVREHKRTINKNIRPVLGDVALRDLDGKVLDDFYVSLMTRPKPLSASSVRRIHAVIAAACKQGVKWGEISGQDPAQAATAPSVPSATRGAPSVEEVQLLIETAEKDDPDMAAFIALAAITGARRGELCGLRWGDVDEGLKALSIVRSYAVVDGEHMFKPTKTHGVRRIALGEFGLEVLRRQRLRLEERASELGLWVTYDMPVFTYDLVDPISPDTASHYVRAIADTAGVDTHLHALRHFAARAMIGDGQDVRTVAGRLGHADASTTLKAYAHMLPQRDLEAAESLGRSLTVGGS